MRTCKDCESAEIVNSGRCREHYNEYMRAYKNERYHRLRSHYLEQLGGKCVDCGSVDSLEFDHSDASQKSFDVSRFHSRSIAAIEEELKKCVLRCTPCHLAKSQAEGDLRAVEHGGGLSGKKNCSCGPCKARKAEYMKDYMATRRSSSVAAAALS